MKRIILTLLLVVNVVCVFGQRKFANTILYDSIHGSPEASLDQVKWLGGHWRGEAFGGITEELWSPPLGGSMMFVFKLVNNGKVDFYETGGIIEERGTLILKIKHFDASFHGWEEKNETVNFNLVKIGNNKVYFDYFTFEHVNDNEINVYVVISRKNGDDEEVKFNYKRVK